MRLIRYRTGKKLLGYKNNGGSSHTQFKGVDKSCSLKAAFF